MCSFATIFGTEVNNPNTFQRRKEGRVEEKNTQGDLRGPGLEPGTYRVLGAGPKLHATGVVQTSKPFRGYR